MDKKMMLFVFSLAFFAGCAASPLTFNFPRCEDIGKRGIEEEWERCLLDDGTEVLSSGWRDSVDPTVTISISRDAGTVSADLCCWLINPGCHPCQPAP
jgi:hypothetical protein